MAYYVFVGRVAVCLTVFFLIKMSMLYVCVCVRARARVCVCDTSMKRYQVLVHSFFRNQPERRRESIFAKDFFISPT